MSSWAELGLTCRALVWSNDSTVGQGLFLGCDNKLYLYKIEEDTYYYVGAVTSGYNIKRLWINSSDSNKVYGVAWGDPSSTEKTTSIKIFSTSGGTNLENIDTITDVFTGEFSYRDGDYRAYGDTGGAPPYRWARFLGQVIETGYHEGTDTKCGENLSIPFDQYLLQTQVTTDSYQYVSATSAITSTSDIDILGTTSTINKETFSRGYYCLAQKYDSSSGNEFDLRVSYGQYGCLELLPMCGGKGSLFLVTHAESGETEQFNFKVFDISGSTLYSIYTSSSVTLDNYCQSSKPFQPTCCSLVAETDDILVGGQCWYEEDEEGYSRSYLIRVNNLSSGATIESPYANVQTLYNSYYDTSYVCKTFIDIKSISSSKMAATFINRDKIGQSDMCGFGEHLNYGPLSNLFYLKYFPSIPRGLVVDSEENIYFTLTNGTLNTVNSLGSYSVCGEGASFVDSEQNLSSNLICVSYTDINNIDTSKTRTEDVVFGVSSPTFPSETQEDAVIGKYYLWKYDNYLTDRVELADFSGLDVWTAITRLVEISPDYICGFNIDDKGSFFLQYKGNTSYTTQVTISTDEVDKNLMSIEKDRGLDEIFNYAEATPSYTKMDDISKELYLSPRTDNESGIAVKVDDIDIDFRSTHSVSTKIICTRSGKINRTFTDIGTSTASGSCALFKWQLYEREIEAIVVGDVSALATTIPLASTFRGGVSATEIDANGNTINKILDDAVNIGDYITVVESTNDAEESQKIVSISGDTITIATGITFAIPSLTTVTITHPFDLGGVSTSWSNEGAAKATISVSSASTIYVDNVRDLAKSLIIQVGSSSLARVSAVGVYSSANSGYTVSVVGNTITATSGDTVYAYFSPSKNESNEYDYYQIGTTGVYIKIDPSDNSSNVNFKEGDRITISSDGLVIEQNDQSKQNAYNMTSLSKYGKIEYDSIDNKFLRRTLAKHYVRKIVRDFGDPHYIFSIDCTLKPTMTFVDSNGLVRVKIYSKKLFPSYNEIIAYPRSIQHNLKQGTTTIVCRDVDPY